MKTRVVIMAAAAAFGLLFWVIDAAFDYFWFYGQSFWGLLISDVPAHEIYVRTTVFWLFIVFGVMLSLVVAARERALAATRASEERYQQLFTEMISGFALHRIICDEQGKPRDYEFLSVNPSFERLTGLTASQVVGKTVREVLPDIEPYWIETYGRVALTGEPVRFEHYSAAVGKHFEVIAYRPHERQFAAIFNDVTERKNAEEQAQKLEAQLRQSQKMEAIGQLAGGIAHDLNNILTAILGNAELAQQALSNGLAAEDPVLQGLAEIDLAGQRAAGLVRRLLAFSRRQVIQPQVLNPNRVLDELGKMLQQLLTENIKLDVILESGVKPVLVDPNMFEQVVLNLVVNARDAMPSGGHLTIETATVVLDESYIAAHADANPGQHVLLAVSDTGSGMDSATLERIFEPFFSTKAADKGTGLGLSTVHGIVKQAGGHVNAYSEPGRGSCFKVYLPVAEAGAVEEVCVDAAPEPPRGSETVLLCEDDHAVRELAHKILEHAGYTALIAENGGEALRLAAEHEGTLHLLVTDVIMPDMNGKEVSEALSARRPGLKTLFVSGYTSNVIAHYGVLDTAVEFLEKPFTRRGLLQRVRDVLDRQPRALEVAASE